MEAADRVDSTTGVQMAYLKQWARRSHNDLALRMPELLPAVKDGPCSASRLEAQAAARELSADLAYIDPPYNQHSYLGNYHVWESLVTWDKPEVYGVACKRVDCRTRKSDFNSKRRFHDALAAFIAKVRARFMVVSFSNEGYIAREDMEAMLGTRGVRLGIMMPDLTRMQVRAIFEAACAVAADGVDVRPEVMIPLTSHVNELSFERELLEAEAQTVMEEQGREIDYQFGTMIEIPRAALTAGEIAECAEFFSFGTNDLTQTTFGISRDDAESGFLLRYLSEGLLPENPFASLDRDGVGRLMQIATTDGRAARPDLEVGICGEHGGDPASIALCHELGLDYVSCSPFRVPIARLAAAHAVLASE